MQIGPHSQRLNAYQVGCFLKPCVYAWRRGDRWLYVGKSMTGLARLGNHHVIAAHKIEPNDEVLVWWGLTTDEQLTRLEAQLILEHRPKFNRATPRLREEAEKIQKFIERRERGRLPPPTRAEIKEINAEMRRPRPRFPVPYVVGEVQSGKFRKAR